MSSILHDTHRLIGALKQRGFNEEQAVGITEAIQQIDLAEVASKGDIQRLENKISLLEGKLREMELRLTVKLGSLLAAGIALLAAMNYFSG